MGALGQRVRQFREAGLAPSAEDVAFARRVLGDGQLWRLFARQTPRDIRHAAATARWLNARGHSDRDLLVAALLHDVGKGAQRRWDRVAWVVASVAGVGTVAACATSRLEVRRAMARSATHAQAGAALLSAAGAATRVIDLTARHHATPEGDAMLELLQAADAAS